MTMMIGTSLLSLEPAAMLYYVGWTAVALLGLSFAILFYLVTLRERRVHQPLIQANRPTAKA